MSLCIKPVRPDDLETFCVAAMLKCGLSEADARVTAEVLVTTDTWGTYTHGTKQLRGLLTDLSASMTNGLSRLRLVVLFSRKSLWINECGSVSQYAPLRFEY